jgi:hypothetical protein
MNKTIVNDDLFESAMNYLGAGDRIPLHWAVEHATSFQSTWAHTRDAKLLLQIAAYIVPRPDLVLAACAVAREALISANNDVPQNTIAIAEQWARHPESSVQDVREAINDAAWEVTETHGTARNAALAAEDASFLVIAADVYDLSDCASSVAENVAEAAWINAPGGADDTYLASIWEELSNIVRAKLTHRDILADLVNANRGTR